MRGNTLLLAIVAAAWITSVQFFDPSRFIGSFSGVACNEKRLATNSSTLLRPPMTAAAAAGGGDGGSAADTTWRLRAPPMRGSGGTGGGGSGSGTLYSPTNSSSSSMSFASSVPRTVWQTVKSHDAPDIALRTMSTWTTLNPTWDRIVLDDDEIDAFVARYYNATQLQLFRSFRLGVMRADLFRYMVLHIHGGVYADADARCNKPIEDWLFPECDVVISPENGRHFCQWFFAARPRHPLFQLVVDMVFERTAAGIDYLDQEFVHETTGPGVFTDAIKQFYDLPADTNPVEFMMSQRARVMHEHDGVCWLTEKEGLAAVTNLYSSAKREFAHKGWKSWLGERLELWNKSAEDAYWLKLDTVNTKTKGGKKLEVTMAAH